MILTTETDRAAAIAALYNQRLAAHQALDVLELYGQLFPQVDCLSPMAGPMSRYYAADIGSLLTTLLQVRLELRGAIEDLSIAMGEIELG